MKKRYVMMVLMVLVSVFLYAPQKAEAKTHTYTVSPDKIPSSVKKSSIYNKNTKNWLQLQYYFKKLEKGGGKLVLKKGVYRISNTLYVPSGVTVELRSGAVLKKINKAVRGIKPAKNMFVLLAYSKKNRKNVSAGYNGPRNIKFIGHGKKSVFDLSYIEGAHGVSSSHNQNVEFRNLTFRGENGGHYIELAGSRNVLIRENRFFSSKSSTREKFYNKEAINIDTPDARTGGFPLPWSRKDQTPNINVRIYKNLFDGMNRGIGTHKFSQKKDSEGNYTERSANVYHENISIKNNIFRNIYDNAVFMVNWKNTEIDSNRFEKIGLYNDRDTNTAGHGIAGGGIVGLTLVRNRFSGVKKSVVYLRRTANNQTGSEYYPVLVYVTDQELEQMKENTIEDCGYTGRYTGYDILVFRGDRNPHWRYACGVDLQTKELKTEYE